MHWSVLCGHWKLPHCNNTLNSQMLQHIPVLARELVPSTWPVLVVMEQKMLFWTVPTSVKPLPAPIFKMLVSCANVRTYYFGFIPVREHMKLFVMGNWLALYLSSRLFKWRHQGDRWFWTQWGACGSLYGSGLGNSVSWWVGQYRCYRGLQTAWLLQNK